MGFGNVFGRAFPATFDRRAAAAAVPSIPAWLAGAPTPIAAYQPKGAASLAASYVNLITPGTDNAAPGTAPTFDTATGWGFAASSMQYLTTGITPTNDQTWSVLCRFSDVTASYQMLFGSTAAGVAYPWFFIEPYTGDGRIYFGNGGICNTAGGLTSGVLGFAGNNAYANGIYYGTIPSQAGVLPAIYIGGSNIGGTTGYYIDAKIQAFAIWNTSTDHATWMPAVSAAMALL